MKTLVTFLTMILIILPMQLAAEDTDHGEKTIKVQAWDFSDPDLDAVKGVPCGEFLAFLMGSEEKYEIINTTGGFSHEDGGGDH